MIRFIASFIFLATIFGFAHGQTMMFSTTNDEYVIDNVFSDVSEFTISIEIDMPLAAGLYENPPINSVVYQVTGVLEEGTPSGFPAFDLQREISGSEFYAQGSSLNFEILETAELNDGVQADELVGDDVILIFNAREIDNGRFHPALFELNEDGTGRIQNSNNIPTEDPLIEVDFGEEYITDLIFDPGNLTLITGVQEGIENENGEEVGEGGGGSISFFLLLGLGFIRFSTLIVCRFR